MDLDSYRVQVLVAIGRDYENCGKAACARSRHCRGFACEAAMADDDEASGVVVR